MTIYPNNVPPEFNLLAKPTGAICNLVCSYCFFLDKELLYPDSKFRMNDEILEIYIRQLIESHARAPEMNIAWQGGEPTLMGLAFFKRSAAMKSEGRSPIARALRSAQRW